MPIAAAMPGALEEVEDEVHAVRPRRAATVPGAHDDRRDAKGPGARRRNPRHGHAAIRRARPRALRRAVRAPHAGHEVLRDARPDGGHRAPEVISLAGGLPDTSTFPAEDFAALMARVGVDDAARALQYGPDRGPRRGQGPDRRGDGRRGHARRPRRPARHHRRPAGHRPRLQDADRPRRRRHRRGARPTPARCRCSSPTRPTSCRSRWTRTACGSTCSRRSSTRLDAEGRAPKFIYTVPSFQNPAGVTMSLERRRRLVEIARERELLVLEDNPYGLLRYEGEPLPTLLSLDGGEYVIYLGTFSKILSPGLRLGWTAAPRPVLDKLNLGKDAADLCSSPLTQLFVRRRTSPSATGARTSRSLDRRSTGAAATSCSRRWPSTSRARRRGPARRAACSSGPRCRTTSTRPTCWPARCARTWRSCPAARRTSTAAAARRCG